MSDTAKGIFQAFLDRSGKLMMSGLYAELSTMMSYPLTVETADGSLNNTSPDDFITSAKAFYDYMQRMGAKDFLRIAKSAEFVEGNTELIDGIHETFILKGGTYVVEPYRNALRLRFVEGEWRGAAFRSSVNNVTVPLLNPAQLRQRALRLEAEAETDQQTKANDNDGLHNNN
ncbi:hypothetical protein [Pseudooctadecabacter jejudonensis]|uniref:Uncharacterized protein n=1 Tax=Pseudooctadecabacter jejudonensis TaxID=1391910 RepID=A0A1Y5SJM3_9RHOB|nr:hypothetical protein [Pseudooctadecabacter jejudonensis]SLN42368.1 hypothetical protein PSJ8397_02155 [Pseudooctadecabacter jejudonensis]